MLDLLPPELVQPIVEYVGLPYWDEYTEPERFANLSSLSLVSKRLQSFAQPLLFAVLTLQATSTDKLLSRYACDERCRELVSNVRFIRCDDHRNPVSSEDLETAKDVIRSIALGAQRLDTLVHSSPELQSMEIFTGTTLRRLHVFAFTAFNLETVFLPQLRELSLAYTRDAPQAISQSRLPSLRHLAITNLNTGVVEGIVTLINTFYHQLDSFSFDMKDLEQLRPQIPHFSFSNLLLNIITGSRGSRNTRAFNSNHRNVQHIRLHHDFDDPGSFDEEELDRFIDFIASALPSLALRTVYIAPDLDTTRSQLTEESRKSKTRLIEACGRRNIEVIEEKVPEVATWDTFISPAFVRRMSSRK